MIKNPCSTPSREKSFENQQQRSFLRIDLTFRMWGLDEIRGFPVRKHDRAPHPSSFKPKVEKASIALINVGPKRQTPLPWRNLREGERLQNTGWHKVKWSQRKVITTGPTALGRIFELGKSHLIVIAQGLRIMHGIDVTDIDYMNQNFPIGSARDDGTTRIRSGAEPQSIVPEFGTLCVDAKAWIPCQVHATGLVEGLEYLLKRSLLRHVPRRSFKLQGNIVSIKRGRRLSAQDATDMRHVPPSMTTARLVSVRN